MENPRSVLNVAVTEKLDIADIVSGKLLGIMNLVTNKKRFSGDVMTSFLSRRLLSARVVSSHPLSDFLKSSSGLEFGG